MMSTHDDPINPSFDLEADLVLAQQVQTSFLPQQIPYVGGIDVHVTHQFAHLVGGDFYDFLPGPANSLLFTIGDISYKGISAALMMAVLRKVLRTAAEVLTEPTPSAILTYANQSMYEDLSKNSMFATAVVGNYHAESRTLSLSNAGHSPVLYRPRNGVTQLLEADHVPLGVTSDEAYTDIELPLRRDDLLILLTDGYMESQNSPGTVFGCESVIRIAESTANQSSKEIARAIYDGYCKAGFGAPSHDDQALLILKGV